MVQLVILLLLASFELVYCVEDPPSNHQEFRDVLNRAVYLDGSGRQVGNLMGFTQWSFKTQLFRDERYIFFGARRGTPMSILQEAKNSYKRGSNRPRIRMLQRDSAFYEVMVLRIPKQHSSVDSFLFAYFVNTRRNNAAGPDARFFALQWSKSQAGKRDWVFARFWKEQAGRGKVEYVPIGPRPESAKSYSIRIVADGIWIYVNGHLVLKKEMPGVGSIPLLRCAGVALNTMPSNTHQAEVFFKSISWGVHWEPQRGN